MANELTYEDYKRRISIRDVLMDAGYSFNRKDGMRYPTYSRRDNEGHNIKGDKFIITANGLCCFNPPEQKNYNIISFIKEHPEMFREYTPGMNLDHLVNQVCCRLLNEPVIANRREDQPAPSVSVEHKEFNLRNFTLFPWRGNDLESVRAFRPYFENRGISVDTQRAFSDYFFLTAKAAASKTSLRNLSFPMRIPGSEWIVGLEMRGAPDRDGNTFKGMALNTNATYGMWLASPALNVTTASELKKAYDVYWFESAYDAMAFYQLNADKRELDRSVFVSTGGSPSMHQFRGLLDLTDRATHHLCFDNDRAGRMFAITFAVARSGKDYTTHIATSTDEEAGIAKEGQLVVSDRATNSERFVLNIEPFDFGRLNSVLGIGKPDMRDYLASLKDRGDIKTGNFNLLPSDSYSARLYRDLLEMKEKGADIQEQNKSFISALYKDAQAFHRPGGCTVYEPCNPRYKDYNDQLLHKPMQEREPIEKKQMSSEDIVESCIDGTEGVFLQFYSAHEEEEDNMEKENEDERKGYHRR